MRHFRSRHGCNWGTTMVYVELATTAFFVWRARAGACHEMMSTPERSVQPDDKAPIRREWRTILCWHPARIWKRE